METGISAAFNSSKSSLSALVKFSATFFFKPGQLCSQLSDFGVKLLCLLLVLCLQIVQRFLLITKHNIRISQKLNLPFGQLVGMNPIFRRNLRQRLLFLQYLQNHLSLDLRGKCSTFFQFIRTSLSILIGSYQLKNFQIFVWFMGSIIEFHIFRGSYIFLRFNI